MLYKPLGSLWQSWNIVVVYLQGLGKYHLTGPASSSLLAYVSQPKIIYTSHIYRTLQELSFNINLILENVIKQTFDVSGTIFIKVFGKMTTSVIKKKNKSLFSVHPPITLHIVCYIKIYMYL
mgnify:CR=1 FL=1